MRNTHIAHRELKGGTESKGGLDTICPDAFSVPRAFFRMASLTTPVFPTTCPGIRGAPPGLVNFPVERHTHTDVVWQFAANSRRGRARADADFERPKNLALALAKTRPGTAGGLACGPYARVTPRDFLYGRGHLHQSTRKPP